MKQNINNELLEKRDIVIENEEMPNGETRFRVKLKDNSGVNITTSQDKAEWQNAHFHKYNKEMYIVQKGKILMATEDNGIINYTTLVAGENILINPMISHNVYMYENSMTFVIKYGETKEKDWNYAENLDLISKKYNFN